MGRWLSLVAAALVLTGCEKKSEQRTAAPAPKMPFNTEIPMKDLMDHAVDPASAVVWAASGYVVDKHGTTDMSPKTKEGWKAVQNNAAILAELANALMLPGRAPDEPQWDGYANALHDSAIAAMKAAERQDKAAILSTGGDIYAACTDCHKRYVLGER